MASEHDSNETISIESSEELEVSVEATPPASSEESSSRSEINNTQSIPVPSSGTSRCLQYDTVYRCMFHLKPEMLEYYYNPGPEGYSDGVPVLLCSPEFDGGMGSKWHVSITFDRWIGMHRWVSLYLTRVDYGPEISMQVEFKVLDGDDKVLFSRRNSISDDEPLRPGECGGFTKFIPFSQISRMLIHGTCFRIEADMTLLTKSEQQNIIVKSENGDSKNGSEASTIVDEEQYFYDDTCFDGIQKDDEVALSVNFEPYAFVNRQKLIDKSASYKEAVRSEYDCLQQVNLMESWEDEFKQRRIIQEYAQFIHTDHCKLLETGSYKNVKMLFDLALKMRTDELVIQCLSTMTISATYEDAAYHVDLLLKHKDKIDMAGDVCSSFRQMFKENFKRIRETQGFKELVKTRLKEFTFLAFSPN